MSLPRIRPVRCSSGQAIVEGTAALILIVAISIGLIYFIISSSMAGYYKYMLGFMATQAATYAAGRPPATVTSDTQAFVKSLEQQMNLGSGNPTTTVTPNVSLSGAIADRVTIQDQFAVLGLGKGFFTVSLQATGVAAYANNPTINVTQNVTQDVTQDVTQNVTQDVTNNYQTGLPSPMGWAPSMDLTNLAYPGSTPVSSVTPYLQSNGAWVTPVYNPANLPTTLANQPVYFQPIPAPNNGGPGT